MTICCALQNNPLNPTSIIQFKHGVMHSNEVEYRGSRLEHERSWIKSGRSIEIGFGIRFWTPNLNNREQPVYVKIEQSKKSMICETGRKWNSGRSKEW